MVQNLWGSLKSAADGHWGDEATVNPEGMGFKITLRLAEKIQPAIWKIASNYIQRYARSSHWKVTGLSHKRGYIEFLAEYTPPKPKKKWDGRRRHRPPHPDGQKNQEQAPSAKESGQTPQP